MTQYLFLLYGDEDGENALSAADRRQIVDAHREFSRGLAERGLLRGGEALSSPSEAKLVRAGRSCEHLVVDGPFAETKEQIGGFYLIECADLDEAVAYAKQIPRSPGLAIEIRPIAAT